MAVTRIRKISSWTMIIVTCISLALFVLFFFGGVGEPYGTNEFKNPTYTGELLIWSYILLAVCGVSMLLFGFVQFGSKFKSNPKAAFLMLGIFAGFAILLTISYSMGDGTLLTIRLNTESQKFNTSSWLKVTDMWLYAMYILSALAILAMIWGSVRKILKK